MRSVVLAFLLPLAAIGCGGSSSETPPPLAPDPTSARYTGPRIPSAAEDAATAAAEPDSAEDDTQRPQHAAAATWGSGKVPSAAAAPKMTSPTALPSAAEPSAAPAP